MIKAVLFDLDNTLLDFMRMKRIAVETAVDRMIDGGFDVDKQKLITEIFNIYETTHIESQNVLEKVITKYAGKLDRRILALGIIGYQRGRDMATYLYPRVEYTIKELIRMGLRIGTVSDAPAEQCYNRLARLHLIPWLDVIITFDDTKEYKPSPKPFKLALEILNVKPKETLYIGDWPERDIVGAKAVGMYTVWAKWGDRLPKNKNVVPKADFECTNIDEIIGVIKKINIGNK